MVIQTNINDYRNMSWRTRESVVKVQHMDTSHIVNTMSVIQKGKGGSFCGHSSEEWLKAFHTELLYRERMANSILKQFPVLFQQLQKAHTKQVHADKHKKRALKYKNKVKVFTTKGVNVYAHQANRTGTQPIKGGETRLQKVA